MEGLLYGAAREGDLPAVEVALRGGANCNQLFRNRMIRDEDLEESALHIACQRNHLPVVRALLDAGAEVNIKDSTGCSPLHHACNYCDNGGQHLAVVQDLVQRGADICMKNNRSGTPLDFAHGAVGEYLLERYIEMLFAREGNCSLHWVLRKTQWTRGWHPIASFELANFSTLGRFIFILRTIMGRNATLIRGRDDNGKMPLHVAASSTDVPFSVLKFLIDQDETVLQIASGSGSLPIHYLVRQSYYRYTSFVALLKLLVERGGVGTLAVRDSQGNLPLHVLCKNHRHPHEFVEYLIRSHPGSLAVRDDQGNLPLHIFCKKDNPSQKSVEYLIRSHPGALSSRNNDGNLPITLARKSTPLSVIYALVRGDPQVVPGNSST